MSAFLAATKWADRAKKSRRIKCPGRGFTLFEVMVGTGLLLLLGLILVRVLIPSFQTTLENQKRVSMQQKAVVIFQRIANDVQDAVPSALSINVSPAVLAGQPLSSFSAEGAPQFATEFWVYYVEGEELRRTVWRDPGPPNLLVTLQAGAPTRLPSMELEKFPLSAIPESRALANKVRLFSLSHVGVGASVAGPITIELALGGTASETARVKMRRVFSPRLGE